MSADRDFVIQLAARRFVITVRRFNISDSASLADLMSMIRDGLGLTSEELEAAMQQACGLFDDMLSDADTVDLRIAQMDAFDMAQRPRHLS